MIASLVTILVAAIGAGGSILAARVAQTAVRNTKPISNGFARDTIHRLDRIEQLITHHIEAHADADLHTKGKS